MEEENICDSAESEIQDESIERNICRVNQETDMAMPTNVKQVHCFYFVKFGPSPEEVKLEEANKLYSIVNLARTRVIDELDQQKADRAEIYRKLKWFTRSDEYIRWKRTEISCLEQDLGCSKICSPKKPRSRMTPFLNLTDTNKKIGFHERPVYINTDRNRHQTRFRKERMDIGYLQQAQEELLSTKKLGGKILNGAEELHDLTNSLIHRIKHGCNNQAQEKKLFREMKKVETTREIYTAPESDPHPPRIWISVVGEGSKKAKDWKREIQHRINNRLNDIEEMMKSQIGRKTKERSLKAKLEAIDKNISYLEKELDKVNSKRAEAYKSAYELRKQKMEQRSCYNEYESLVTNVEKLAKKSDVTMLKQMCHKQVEEFISQWSSSEAFRDDYERTS